MCSVDDIRAWFVVYLVFTLPEFCMKKKTSSPVCDFLEDRRGFGSWSTFVEHLALAACGKSLDAQSTLYSPLVERVMMRTGGSVG